MKRAFACILAIFVLILLLPNIAYAEQIPSESLQELPKVFELDLGFLEDYYDALDGSINKVGFDRFFEGLKNGELDGKGFIVGLFSLFFKSLTGKIPKLATLVVLTLIYGALGASSSGILSDGAKKVLRFCLLLSIASYLSVVVGSVMAEGKELMELMKAQTYASFPVILSLLFALGGNTSTALFQPILYFLSVVMTEITVNVIYPLFIFSFAVSLLSYVGGKGGERIASFVKSLSSFILRTVFIVFTSAMGISGVFAYGVDSVAYRTAKFAISGGVPIVGGFVKDSLDMVMMTGVSIKNTLGIAVLIIFILSAALPIVSTYLSALSLRCVSAITSTFSEEDTPKLFERCAEGIETLGATLLTVLIMFIEGIFALILSTGYIL